MKAFKERLIKRQKILFKECASHGLTLELLTLKMPFLGDKYKLSPNLLELNLKLNNLRRLTCMQELQMLNPNSKCMSMCFLARLKSRSKLLTHLTLRMRHFKLRYNSLKPKMIRIWENNKNSLTISWMKKELEMSRSIRERLKRYWLTSIYSRIHSKISLSSMNLQSWLIVH